MKAPSWQKQVERAQEASGWRVERLATFFEVSANTVHNWLAGKVVLPSQHARGQMWKFEKRFKIEAEKGEK